MLHIKKYINNGFIIYYMIQENKVLGIMPLIEKGTK